MNIKDIKNKLTTKDIKIIIISLGGEIFSEKDNIIKFKVFYNHGNSNEVLFYYTSTKVFYSYVQDKKLDIFDITSNVKNIKFAESVRYIKKMLNVDTTISNLKEKFEILSMDIDGYVDNVFCEENADISINDLRQEMVCICEYMKAMCDLMAKGNIESDYLGVASVINKI